MNVLAIETSGDIGSVALWHGNRMTDREIATPREQTSRLLPLIEELLSAEGIVLRDLDVVAFGRGPGSFTGIRLATAVAQGLGLAAGLPLIPVSSLAVIAQRAWRTAGHERSLVAVDARMGEIFWSGFQTRQGLAVPLGAERLGPPEAVEWPGSPAFACVGSAFAGTSVALASLAELAVATLGDIGPTASDLIPLACAEFEAGRGVAAVDAAPTYLREQSAWTPRTGG